MKPRLHGLRPFHFVVPRGTSSCHSPGVRIRPGHAGPSGETPPGTRVSRRPGGPSRTRPGALVSAAARTEAGLTPQAGAARRRSGQRRGRPEQSRRSSPLLRSAPGRSAAPQNRGFLAGTPLRRGKRSGHGSRWRRVRYSKPSWTTSAGSRPSWRSGAAGHRVPRASSGSVRGLRRQQPAPTLRRGAATRPAQPAVRRSGPAPRQSPPSSPAPARTPRLAPRAPRHGPRGPGARPLGGGRPPGGRWPPAAPQPPRATRWPPRGPAAAPRTKVHEPDGAPPGQAAGDGREALGVPYLRIQGTGPEEAQGASFRQELTEISGGVTPFVGAGHRRRVSPRAR